MEREEEFDTVRFDRYFKTFKKYTDESKDWGSNEVRRLWFANKEIEFRKHFEEMGGAAANKEIDEIEALQAGQEKATPPPRKRGRTSIPALVGSPETPEYKQGGTETPQRIKETTPKELTPPSIPMTPIVHATGGVGRYHRVGV